MISAQTSITPDDDSSHHQPLTPGTFILHGRVFGYPSLACRYKAMAIDAMLIFTVMIFAMVGVKQSPDSPSIMMGLAILLSFYEPLFSRYGGTVGQRFMGIRVRDYQRPFKPASFWQALLRLWTKCLLGWLSFITVQYNKEHRAIHDMASSTIVIRLS
jgi:uncharacterized RDD family membrane protein YckC